MPRGGGSRTRKPLYKVVVRRLPPDLTWEDLKEQLKPLPNDLAYECFEPARNDFLPYKFSRCYLAFRSEQDTIEFSRRFNNYQFVDSKGQSSFAVVEMAPYQELPRANQNRVKSDPKCGTIQSDHSYKQFVDKLQANVQTPLTIDEQVKLLKAKADKDKEGILVTPLTRHMMLEADAKVAKISQRRNRLLEKEDRRRRGYNEPSKAATKEKRDNERRQKKYESRQKKVDSRFERREKKKEISKKKESEKETTKEVDEATKNLKETLGINSSKLEENNTQAKKPESKTAGQAVRTFSNRKFRGTETRASPSGNAAGTENETENRDDRDKGEVDSKKKRRPEVQIYRPGGRFRKATGSGASAKQEKAEEA